jgi:hypothetical protein
LHQCLCIDLFVKDRRTERQKDKRNKKTDRQNDRKTTGYKKITQLRPLLVGKGFTVPQFKVRVSGIRNKGRKMPNLNRFNIPLKIR